MPETETETETNVKTTQSKTVLDRGVIEIDRGTRTAVYRGLA